MSNDNQPQYYTKRPVTIEAIEFTGDNELAIMNFVGKQLSVSKPPHRMEHDRDIPNEGYSILIPTLEGDMLAIRGDYIIKGVKGEFYPCKPDVFSLTYAASQPTGQQFTPEEITEITQLHFTKTRPGPLSDKIVNEMYGFEEGLTLGFKYADQQIAAIQKELDRLKGQLEDSEICKNISNTALAAEQEKTAALRGQLEDSELSRKMIQSALIEEQKKVLALREEAAKERRERADLQLENAVLSERVKELQVKLESHGRVITTKLKELDAKDARIRILQGQIDRWKYAYGDANRCHETKHIENEESKKQVIRLRDKLTIAISLLQGFPIAEPGDFSIGGKHHEWYCKRCDFLEDNGVLGTGLLGDTIPEREPPTLTAYQVAENIVDQYSRWRDYAAGALPTKGKVVGYGEDLIKQFQALETATLKKKIVAIQDELKEANEWNNTALLAQAELEAVKKERDEAMMLLDKCLQYPLAALENLQNEILDFKRDRLTNKPENNV